MPHYAIGDVQGCFDPFIALLEKIQFNPTKDMLLLAGDLVNRGPDSLKVLRYIKSLGSAAITILGNHDLHALAVFFSGKALRKSDTLNELLQAPDVEELMEWLSLQPLLYHNALFNSVLTHAGIYPLWSLIEAKSYAKEIESLLREKTQRHNLLSHFYGNDPSIWDMNLSDIPRYRFIVNALTRMRFLRSDGALDFSYDEKPENAPKDLIPWFNYPRKTPITEKILFGHWAALEGYTGVENVIALDTGCAWGESLTAYCLETEEMTQVECRFEL
jgi:bis(5'-nucleosyl)-tetraphosphatase (symmetrical)